MRAASGAVRLAGLVLLLATGWGTTGCTVDATGLRVTVRTHGLSVDRLEVTVFKGQSRIGGGQYTGTVDDGASFGVLLPDSLDGTVVTVQIEASRGGAGVASGVGQATVMKRIAVALSVDLTGGVDGGVDAIVAPDLLADGGALPDLSGPDLRPAPDLSGELMADLAGLDLVVPDLAGVDLASQDMARPPDLYMPPDLVCDPSCANGVYSYCDGNGKKMALTCGFGCNGPQCNGPSSCNSAGDISNAGTYNASTLGSMPTATGTCQAVAGPDNTLKLTPKVWSKVTLALSASFPAALWARTICGTQSSEYVANGLCNQMPLAPACLAGNANQTMVLCGLPPSNTAFAFVEHPAGVGGLYAITSSFAPQSLNTCAEAGMLPGNAFSYNGDTTNQAAMNTAPPGPMGSACNNADRGMAAPEMVFWVPIGVQNMGKTLTVTVTGLNGFSPFLYTQTYCQPASTLCFTTVNNVATAKFAMVAKDTALFFFVDGLNGAKGQFKLDMTLQ